VRAASVLARIGPAVYGVLMLATRMAVAGTGALSLNATDSFDFWSGILLLAALPSLGATHMIRLAPGADHSVL